MINKQQVIYYFTLFVILLKHIIIPGIFGFMTSKFVSQKVGEEYKKPARFFSWFFWGILTNFYGLIGIIAIIIAGIIIIMGNSSNNNKFT